MFDNLFEYDGINLIWKDRGRSDFASDRAYNRNLTLFVGKVAGCKCSNSGYILLNIKGKRFLAHRVIWNIVFGDIPEGMEIDHINHVRDDNRIENLRLVEKKDNQKNLSRNKRNKTGVNGVSLTKQGKYYAQIGVNGKTVSLGYYSNIDDAIRVRLEYEKKLKYHINHGGELCFC